MKVFISWSGNLSKRLANSLREWLPKVIQAASPYFSPDDITKGTRWSTEISKELEECKVGIFCLTRDNLQAPWIMFEAGALSKNIAKSKVCPILFGVDATDIQGPLVQFQAARFDKEEMKKVMNMINTELAQQALQPNVFDSAFEMWWPSLEETIDQELKKEVPIDDEALRSERDLLEELLELSRASSLAHQSNSLDIIPQAIEDVVRTFHQIVLQLKYKRDPKTICELLLRFGGPIDYLIGRTEAPPGIPSRYVSKP